MRDLCRQWPRTTVFVAALAVRIGFLALVDQPPVQFDARQYVSVAVAAPLALTHPSLWTDSSAREQLDFTRVFDDVISDEDVAWFPYGIPRYRDALDYIYYSGPVYPAMLSAIINLTPAYDFLVIRIIQALIDSLSAVLLWVLMRRLISLRGAWIAATSWTIYGPAILKVGELLTETTAICLLLLSVLALFRAYDTQQRRWLILAGGLCALLALTKASTALLIVVMVVTWLLANRRGRLGWLSSASVLLATWGLVMLPWFLLVYHRYGQFSVRDPSYGDANFRQANILETEGYYTDAAPPDFWTYPVWRDMREQPLAYAKLYLQKFRRLWWRASDDYRLGFPFGVTGVEWFHRLIVLFALVGLFLWPQRAGPVAWIPIGVVLYFAGLHTVMHVVSRYNLLAMPFVTGSAVVGGLWLADELRPGVIRRLAGLLTVIAVAFGLIMLLRPTSWLLLPGISAPSAISLFVGAGGVIIVIAVWWIITRPRTTGVAAPLLVTAISMILTALFFAWATTSEAQREWSHSITSAEGGIRYTIELPESVDPESVDTGILLIDAQMVPGSTLNIVLQVDHIRMEFPDSGLVVEESFYAKPHYRSFMRVNGDHPGEIRGWSRHVFEGPLLDSILHDREVDVMISLQGRPEINGALKIYGGLPEPDMSRWVGPGIKHSSIERYYEREDPRVWETLKLESTSRQSVRIEKEGTESTDLSQSLGRQPGNYRILLVLLLKDGSRLYY